MLIKNASRFYVIRNKTSLLPLHLLDTSRPCCRFQTLPLPSLTSLPLTSSTHTTSISTIKREGKEVDAGQELGAEQENFITSRSYRYLQSGNDLDSKIQNPP
jgi:hypothetical protein